MAVSAVSNLGHWLSQVNGSHALNLTAATTAHSGVAQSSQTQSNLLVNVFDNLMQQLAAASNASGGASAGTSGSANAVNTGAHPQRASAADLEAILNQLVQNLKLTSSSTNATGTTAAAQSLGSTSQSQLLSILQKLAQQVPSYAGRLISTVV